VVSPVGPERAEIDGQTPACAGRERIGKVGRLAGKLLAVSDGFGS
jgi:hypothetical protein